MFEGIGLSSWIAAACLAATGAALIALVGKARLRNRLLCLWLVAPVLIATAASSFDTERAAFELLLMFLLFVGLPWTLVALPAFLLVRLSRHLRSRGLRSER